jgi:hypothetical protein
MADREKVWEEVREWLEHRPEFGSLREAVQRLEKAVEALAAEIAELKRSLKDPSAP